VVAGGVKKRKVPAIMVPFTREEWDAIDAMAANAEVTVAQMIAEIVRMTLRTAKRLDTSPSGK